MHNVGNEQRKRVKAHNLLLGENELAGVVLALGALSLAVLVIVATW